VWRGTFQSPKSENAVRSFTLPPRLLLHIADLLKRWKPNDRDLFLATRNWTPLDANLLAKRKAHSQLDSLGIERGGLHAFRHTNSTLMYRLDVPFKVRRQRLGHSDSSLILDVYTHFEREDDMRVASLLDGILHPIAPKKEKPEQPISANSDFI
jgi:integrase